MTGPWWVGATIYHAYVRSFRDSDGDGYGDLGGLLEKLDYLRDLGITALWLSPIMPSPDHDWGYDVSDYRGIHPELGTLDDFDVLITRCRDSGIRVIVDLVPNHTSSAHPWFVEAASSTQSPFRDYYVWADARADGTPPNNWVDDTGMPAWTWDEGTRQFYMHNFLDTQPDLNWWNPEVHNEFRGIIDFWFDRGVAGFRIDVANGLYHDRELRDNPLHPRAYIGDTEIQGRYGIQHVHNFNQPEVHDVYRQWRTQAESRDDPRLMMGETWVSRVDELAPYYGTGDELQLALNFPFLFAPFDAPALARVVADSVAAFPADAAMVWASSNHDVSRAATPVGGRRSATGPVGADGRRAAARDLRALLRRRVGDDGQRHSARPASRPADRGKSERPMATGQCPRPHPLGCLRVGRLLGGPAVAARAPRQHPERRRAIR